MGRGAHPTDALYLRTFPQKVRKYPERSQWPRRPQSRILDGRYGRRQSGGHVPYRIA